MYEYILLFSVLTYYLIISQYSEISTNEFIKVKLFPIILFSIIFLITLITYISYTFITRTTKYKNYLKKCKKLSKNTFCHISMEGRTGFKTLTYFLMPKISSLFENSLLNFFLINSIMKWRLRGKKP